MSLLGLEIDSLICEVLLVLVMLLGIVLLVGQVSAVLILIQLEVVLHFTGGVVDGVGGGGGGGDDGEDGWDAEE